MSPLLTVLKKMLTYILLNNWVETSGENTQHILLVRDNKLRHSTVLRANQNHKTIKHMLLGSCQSACLYGKDVVGIFQPPTIIAEDHTTECRPWLRGGCVFDDYVITLFEWCIAISITDVRFGCQLKDGIKVTRVLCDVGLWSWWYFFRILGLTFFTS